MQPRVPTRTTWVKPDLVFERDSIMHVWDPTVVADDGCLARETEEKSQKYQTNDLVRFAESKEKEFGG